MNVSSASGAIDLWKLLEASQTTSTSNVSSTSATGSSSVTSASGDASSLSGVAHLFGKLEALSKSNPAEFQKITAQISTRLQAAAKNATDPKQAAALNQLASNFQNASTSGNFSDLFPQSEAGTSVATSGHSGGQHHHYHAGSDNDDSTSTTSPTTQSTDPLSSIFSDALKQIATDLQTAATTTTP